MKILLIANTASDILLRDKLLSQLIRLGHTLFVASSINKKNEEVLLTRGIRGIAVDFTPRGTNPIKDIFLYFAYKKIFKQLKPDLVLSYHIKPNIYGAMVAKRQNIPIICNITGLGKVFDHDSILQRLVVNLYKKAFTKNKNAFIFFQNRMIKPYSCKKE